MVEFQIPDIIMPSDEQLRESALAHWQIGAATSIDAWPAHIAALSMPTTLIPVEPTDLIKVYDETDIEAGLAVMDRLAAEIDKITGYRDHFIRLNTRSPKDATYPGLPITCAGKQAMRWIASSERCMDDVSMLLHANKPCYIAVRENVYISPAYEMRCFAKGGQLIAISRYHFESEPAQGWTTHAKAFERCASEFYQNHLAASYPDVVFDLAPGQGNNPPLLIELNPYGYSHPCCFRDYADIETNGGVRSVK